MLKRLVCNIARVFTGDRYPVFRCAGLFVALACLVSACNGRDPAETNPDYKEIEVWVHSGTEAERRAIQDQVNRFNNSQYKVRVNAVVLPQGSYESRVQAAADSGELPDLLEFNGPFAYRYVWRGDLAAIDKHLTDRTRLDLLQSVIEQGLYRGRIYTVATHDSGLALYVRRNMLESAGIRIPTSISEAWTVDEFNDALRALAARDPDGAVLDLKLNYAGEWYTYAFSPIIQSAGGDLIDRRDYQSSEGMLNGEAAVTSLQMLQEWIDGGYVDPNGDDAAFVDGRVAISWAGHEEFRRYSETFGDDLTIVPLPDFGQGPKTGQGAWSWAVTKETKDLQAAMHFLEFLLRPDEVLAISNANGAIPATQTAIRESPLYHKNGPLRLFVEQLREIAVPRPRTPAYSIITTAFQQAFREISNGADVQTALDAAVRMIDRDIEENQGYSPRR